MNISATCKRCGVTVTPQRSKDYSALMRLVNAHICEGEDAMECMTDNCDRKAVVRVFIDKDYPEAACNRHTSNAVFYVMGMTGADSVTVERVRGAGA